MGIYYESDRRRWVVRWTEDGKRHVRRFADEDEAREFAASVGAPGRRAPWSADSQGDGVYAYETKDGVRYRFLFRQADGTLSTRRGFTSRRAAVAARRRLIDSIERGEVKPARESFGEFWARYLEERKPYLSSGTFVDYESHGRKRLLPTFGSVRSEDRSGGGAAVDAGAHCGHPGRRAFAQDGQQRANDRDHASPSCVGIREVTR